MKLYWSLITFLLFSLLLLSCGQKHDIEAQIEGLGSDTILIEYASGVRVA